MKYGEMKLMQNRKGIVKTLPYVFIKLWKFDKKTIILSFICIIFLSLQSYINVALTKLIVDNIAYGNFEMLFIFISIVLAFKLVETLLTSYRRYREFMMSEKFGVEERYNLIDIISDKELIEKEHPKFRGEFSIWSFASSRYLDIYISLSQIIQALMVSLLLLYYLLSSFWICGISILIVLIIKFSIEIKIMPMKISMNNEVLKKNRNHEYFYQILTESSTQKELTSNSLFNYFKDKWFNSKNEVLGIKYTLEKKIIYSDVKSQLVSLCNYALVTVGVLFLITNQKLSIGDYVAITASIGVVEYSLYSVIGHYSRMIENLSYLYDFKEKIKEKTNEKYFDNSKLSFSFNKSISVKNLSFSYPNSNENNLKNIDLEINKSEKVVILGDNGAGKSTLIKLLLGLYKAPMSTIYYDGIPQELINRHTIASKSSVLFQDYINYMLTLRENLTLYNQTGNTDIYDLLKKVRMEEMSSNLDKNLGNLSDDAINISGGQWQKVALARVINKNMDFIICDEPTAALDPFSELEILDTLISEANKATVIIVTHRIGIAAKVDKIIFMKNGEVIEYGTHDELLTIKGHYYEVWLKQSEWYSKSGLAYASSN
ncbi:ATP-binding cassette domain-containing protein [Paenibacillus agaridevorans]|uniref:ATP-binding cassette domain-containing protein n=1 Tax=Paenibacillus agaridevorans TaxID=171404 RepID=UPI001BE44CA7|nr:ATP-binding cassette domain-containing protein [Paenibacillus agaridevorans]